MKTFNKILQGYRSFRQQYAMGDRPIMQSLSYQGQKPQIMIVACCDSRVDPALILQCDPGDLFVVRNVANIVPPYEIDDAHHGTSAALEFGLRFLNIGHLILLGHSQCGGIQALLNSESTQPNDFITNWVSLIKVKNTASADDDFAKEALQHSRENCMTFPWIKEKVNNKLLYIHLWYFDIKTGQIFTYSDEARKFMPLETAQTFLL